MLLLPLDEIDVVCHAESGVEAIEIIKCDTDIDLVLLDYNLDDGLGIDVLLRMRTLNPKLPIAIISADDNPKVIQKCIRSGATGYILKRMKSAQIGLAVKKLLAGETYIPDGALEIKFKDDLSNVDQLAEVARHIMHNQDLSIRATDVEETPGGMVSAFNSLLDHLHDNQQLLKELAFCDELTGLYNRRYFLEQLENAFKQQKRSNSRFALVYIDLDFFKNVNDTHGHQTGDDLLKAIAKRIKGTARETDVAARIGGDEFTMIINDLDTIANLKSYLDRLLKCILAPMQVGDLTIHPSASIGAALSREGTDIDGLMRQADQALYKVKQRGRKGIEVFY